MLVKKTFFVHDSLLKHTVTASSPVPPPPLPVPHSDTKPLPSPARSRSPSLPARSRRAAASGKPPERGEGPPGRKVLCRGGKEHMQKTTQQRRQGHAGGSGKLYLRLVLFLLREPGGWGNWGAGLCLASLPQCSRQRSPPFSSSGAGSGRSVSFP